MSESTPNASLPEIHGKVQVPPPQSFFKRLLAFAGPAYLVSVGYMDPGNWATDIAAGSRYGTALLWVLAMSNLMALLLQSLSTRLGIVAGLDLAQACRAMYSKRVTWALWILVELAIAATDLAEVLGSAIGLQLLFGLPLSVGVILTAFDTFLLLILHGMGIRMMEAFIVVLITTIGVCLGIEIVLVRPDAAQIARGLIPSLPDHSALYLAIGILGATVMPHNLYLHSSLVQSRRIVRTPSGIRNGLRFNLLDSLVALNGAFLVNAALLVMAAAAYHRFGWQEVASIQEAHRLLEPILGARIAPIAFAIALIASGQSSAITGTLAGQIVMEGFVQLRLRPLIRRMVTRGIALIPALATILLLGEKSSGNLLVLSQVILSLQLSFAVIPLIHLVSDRRWMGQYVVPSWMQITSWTVALLIAGLNIKLAYDEISGWVFADGAVKLGALAIALPLAAGLLFLLGNVTFVPFIQRARKLPTPLHQSVHGPQLMPALKTPPRPQKIAAAVDFSMADSATLSHAVAMAKTGGKSANILLLHIVESGATHLIGDEIRDDEARNDQERLEFYCRELSERGVNATFDLGFGDPADELAQLLSQHRPDLVVLGGHGHSSLGDFVHGTTVERLRHQTKIPLLVIPTLDEAA